MKRAPSHVSLVPKKPDISNTPGAVRCPRPIRVDRINKSDTWGFKSLRVGDFAIVVILLAVTIAWLVVGIKPLVAGSFAVVKVNGEQVAQIKLGSEDYISIKGALGPVLIGVDGSGVRILDSRCPNKLCTRMGPIKNAGEWIACVPNKLIIRIDGSRDADAITPGEIIK
jgi:hypothetical protein